ncbi:MAG TPA: ABC transporter permease [Candidatus Sulfotelmatobacter sp.]|nr:ABC transporter permease [Candidatus Sulfotelmatobacter sp.]
MSIAGQPAALSRLALPLRAASLLAPATLVVVAALGLPMLLMLRYSFNAFVPGKFMVEALTGENYLKFVTDPYYRGVLATTVEVALGCTAISLVGAFPVATFLARTQSRHKSLLLILVVLPLLVGNVVRAAGWIVVLGTKGVVNSLLLWLGVVDHPVTLLYTGFSVMVGIITVVLPYMILTLQSVLEGIDPALEEAALNLGAGGARAFWRITLPLALPGVGAGTALVFILCMNAYATPVLLGGPSFHMMAPVLADEIATASNWPFGAALAFVLIAVTLLLTALAGAAFRRRYSAADPTVH